MKGFLKALRWMLQKAFATLTKPWKEAMKIKKMILIHGTQKFCDGFELHSIFFVKKLFKCALWMRVELVEERYCNHGNVCCMLRHEG